MPPFHAEHLGSLLRPDELLQLLRSGEDPAKLKEVQKREIKKSVDMQRSLGFKAVTDGEYSRHMFYDGFFDNLTGMKFVKDPPFEIFKLYVPDVAAFVAKGFRGGETYLCEGKLKREKDMYVPEFKYTASCVPPEEVKNVKITLAAPEWYHLRHGENAYDKSVYKTDEEYFADIAIAYQQELKALYEAGCRNVQFDDPLLAYFCAQSMLDGMKEAGIDSEKELTKYLNLYIDVLKNRPRDLHVGLHLCRGNFKGGVHFSEGGYDVIAQRLFNEVDVDTYYLEYDTERAGTFAPLSFVPANKNIVLGLISSKLPQLEDKEELKVKINQAAQLIAKGGNCTVEEAMKRISISPQCGFASHSDGNKVTADDMEKKLKLVVETARDVW
ncbi:UROD/MetE-like protein, partial [Atractiella rhizophila]